MTYWLRRPNRLPLLVLVLFVVGLPTSVAGGSPLQPTPVDSGGENGFLTVAQAIVSGPLDVRIDGEIVASGLDTGEIRSIDVQPGTALRVEFVATPDTPSYTGTIAEATISIAATDRPHSLLGYVDADGAPNINLHVLDATPGADDTGCVVAYHAMIGPPVDVLLNESVARRGLTPGAASQALSPADLVVSIGVAPAGTTAVVATRTDLTLPTDRCIAAYVTGDLGQPGSVRLLVTDLAPARAQSDWNASLGPAEVTFTSLISAPVGLVQIGEHLYIGTFESGEGLGPFAIDGGSLAVGVATKPQGGLGLPAIRSTVDIVGGTITDLVAHRSPNGEPTISSFARQWQPTPAETACVIVRHTGAGPAIDVLIDGVSAGPTVAAGKDSGRILVEPGRVAVSVTPPGAPAAVLGLTEVRASEGSCVILSLVGDSSESVAMVESTFRLGVGPAPTDLPRVAHSSVVIGALVDTSASRAPGGPADGTTGVGTVPIPTTTTTTVEAPTAEESSAPTAEVAGDSIADRFGGILPRAVALLGVAFIAALFGFAVARKRRRRR